ncbi:MAG: glycosyltransferase family 4 protein [Candidatus Pacebacteria bacterium]|nr:glycosyltransferase family 4 protein [Candidatus Paceibacterota bacterium]
MGTGRHVTTLRDGLVQAGHVVITVPYQGSFFGYCLRAIRMAKGCDVVHAIDMNPLGFAAYIATLFSNAKLVITAQGTYAVAPLHNRKTAWLSRMVYRRAALIVAISAYTADLIRAEVPEVRIEIISPGIDLSKFKLNEPSEKKRAIDYVLSVGAVKPRKGYDVSLRAFALAQRELPNLRYIIVGSYAETSGYFEKLRVVVRGLGLEKSVEFKKGVSDSELNQLYDNAALFILTSVNQGFHFEGFGMVFIEAAAHGVPGVGTKGNGIENAIKDGVTGILVPQKDPEATASAIKRLLHDRVLYERMSEAARDFACEHDQRDFAKQYERVYQTL